MGGNLGRKRGGGAWEGPALALAGAALSLAYALTNPPFESPDEPGHVAYVNFVAATGRWPELDHESDRVEMGHHHPGAYILLAGALRAVEPDGRIDFELTPRPNPIPRRFSGQPFAESSDHRAFLVLRSLGCMAMATTVWATWSSARLLGGRRAAWSAAGLVAFLPQFQFVCGSVSNDPWVAAAGSLATLGALRWVRGRLHGWGVATAVAVLVKKSAVALAPIGLLATTLAPRRVRGRAWVQAVPVLLALGLVAGRNALRYGDPTGNEIEAELYSHLVERKPIASGYFLGPFPYWSARSFLGHLGWMSLELPARLLGVVALPWVVGAAGSAAPGGVLWRKRSGRGAWVCAATVGLVLAGVAYYNTTYTQPQGRLMFPALSALATLCGLGWARALSRKSASLDVVAALGLLGASLAVLRLNALAN